MRTMWTDNTTYKVGNENEGTDSKNNLPVILYQQILKRMFYTEYIPVICNTYLILTQADDLGEQIRRSLTVLKIAVCTTFDA